MDIYPLKRNYGISSRFTILIIIGILALTGANIYVVLNTNLGASFYSYWLSSRVLFAQGENPYGAQFFDQVAANFPEEPYLSGFTLPLYSVIFVVLFSFINNFEIALILWMTILEAALVFAGIKLFFAFRIERLFFTPARISLLLFFCYYAVLAIADGDIGILSVMLLLVGLDAIRQQEDEFAGIILAFATMKFSLTLLPILWILIWCLFNQRRTVVIWFLMVLTLLIMLAVLFMTSWFVEFFRSVIYYYKYLKPIFFSRLIENWQPELGGRIGWAISGFFIVILLIEWVVNSRADIRAFEWVTALTITIGFLSGIPNLGKNLYVLWIPLIYALDKINMRWTVNGKWINWLVTLAFFLIPWTSQIQPGNNFLFLLTR